MKIRIFILFLLLPFSLFPELMSVPGYDYSINPLEGWKLQPYEDDSELSWLSNDKSIALKVSSWSGDTYSDISTMFGELTTGMDASGNFVPFSYLSKEGAIGEISFKITQRDYKGWFIFINGKEFDYYLMAFTLIDNYDDSYNKIQSVLDSFSPGTEGALSPGPISSFLSNSPNNTDKIYTVDFFNHPLNIKVSEYEFTNSQSVIEREADIMEDYSLNPELFYKAWKRYYKIIFRDNYKRLDPLYLALKPYLTNDKYTKYDKIELLMFWIQSYSFERLLETKSDLLSPLEGSSNKIGDCDSRSLILGILLHKFNIESILLTSEKVKHAIIAVDCNGEGFKYKYNNKDFLGIELTTKALIGEIEESLRDSNLWTPVEMEYSNGF